MDIVPHPDTLFQLYFFCSEFLTFFQAHQVTLPDTVPSSGRHSKLSVVENMTISLYQKVTKQPDIKSYYRFIKGYHGKDFPHLPDYSNFLKQQKRLLPLFGLLLNFSMLLNRVHYQSSPLQLMFVDGSEIPVCTNKRIFNHKVAKEVAARGKSTKGWFYGFKLHVLSDAEGNLLGIRITPGNVDERTQVIKLLKALQGILVGDAGYISKELQDKLAKLNVWFLTGVRKTQKKLMTKTDHILLKARQRVETTIGVLKQRMGFVTSLPRSITGLQVHFLLVCLAYCVFGMLRKKQLPV